MVIFFLGLAVLAFVVAGRSIYRVNTLVGDGSDELRILWSAIGGCLCLIFAAAVAQDNLRQKCNDAGGVYLKQVSGRAACVKGEGITVIDLENN